MTSDQFEYLGRCCKSRIHFDASQFQRLYEEYQSIHQQTMTPFFRFVDWLFCCFIYICYYLCLYLVKFCHTLFSRSHRERDFGVVADETRIGLEIEAVKLDERRQHRVNVGVGMRGAYDPVLLA